MGLDDIIDQGKETLSRGRHVATGAADDAKSGAAGLVDKAKDLVDADDIDTVAEKIKDFTPDGVDDKVDLLAEKAKEALGDD